MNQLSQIIEKINQVLSKKETLNNLEIDLLKKYTLEFYEQLSEAKPELMVSDFKNMPSFEAPKPIEEMEKKEEAPIAVAEIKAEETKEPVSVMEDTVSGPFFPMEEKPLESPVIERKEEQPQEVLNNIPEPVTEKTVEAERIEAIGNETVKIETPVAPKPVAKNAYARIEDLKKAISIQKKFEFINSLFGNDHEAYAKAIHQLNNMSNLEVAQSYLTEIKNKQNWQEDDKLANELMELVHRRYS